MTKISATDLSPLLSANVLIQNLTKVGVNQKNSLRLAVSDLLHHPDADVREEAFRVVFVRWKDKMMRAQLLDALFTDGSATVRSVAAYGVSASGDELSRASDTQLLVSVVRNESEEIDVRASAYDALLLLYRRSPFPSLKRPFDPGTDVDWAWIEQLAKDTPLG